MMMRYDFDMVPVIPVHMRRSLKERGLTDTQLNEKVAQFRDKRVIEALKAADVVVRDVFKSAGFGMTVSGTDLADDTHDAATEADRLRAMMRLHDTMAVRVDAVRGADWGQFSIAAFLDQTGASRPVEVAGGNAPDTVVRMPKVTRPEGRFSSDRTASLGSLMGILGLGASQS